MLAGDGLLHAQAISREEGLQTGLWYCQNNLNGQLSTVKGWSTCLPQMNTLHLISLQLMFGQ